MCPTVTEILYLIHDFILDAIQIGFEQILYLNSLPESVDYVYIFCLIFADHLGHEKGKTVRAGQISRDCACAVL